MVTLITVLLSSTLVLLTSCSSDTNTAADSTQTESQDTSEGATSLLVYGEVKVDQLEEIQLDFPARV